MFILVVKPELERSLEGNPDIVHPQIYDVTRAFDKIGFKDTVGFRSMGVEALELTETHLRLCRTPQPDRINQPVPR